NNGREVLQVSPAKDLRERAFQIFGGMLVESLLPVAGGRDFVATISGYVSAPRERRTNKDSQYFFVNRRFVRDKVIAGGLIEGYRSVLPHGVYPVAFLFLEVPLEEIDVNVHPAKTEIRFRRGEAVKDAIAEAVREALGRAGIVAMLGRPTIFPDADEIAISAAAGIIEAPVVNEQSPMQFTRDSVEIPIFVSEDSRYEPSDDAPFLHHADAEIVESEIGGYIAQDPEAFGTATLDSGPDDQQPTGTNQAEMPPVNSAERFTKAAEVKDVSGHKIRPIAQLHNSFIIAVDDEGLLLVDQHVAHERILFDKYRAKETGREIESQQLLLPETVDLSPTQAEALHLVEDELEAIGFDLMKLSGRTVAIKSIPTDLPASEARNLFAELLDSIDLYKRGSAKSSLRDDIAASLACKAAIKINMKLSPEKMQWLIDRLLLTSSPTTCPHGRPVILRLTMKDIERGFHRT
ncbi:MAG TPA: DNA mismatch repair endonuclease MutL, partial [Pyrinomonadaceae bacterium]|nr:DNA mismatch repair endonuclease MutL [Pyrinomonadaceae bacterium]